MVLKVIGHFSLLNISQKSGLSLFKGLHLNHYLMMLENRNNQEREPKTVRLVRLGEADAEYCDFQASLFCGEVIFFSKSPRTRDA